MFLLNMFKGSAPSPQEQKCDRIHFKINLNDHVPRYEQNSDTEIEQEQQLTPQHPLYETIFPPEEQECEQYTTTQDDTLFGIAIKLDISEKTIKSMNNITDHLYPGMKLKLPLGTDLSLLQPSPSVPSAQLRMSQLLKPQPQTVSNLKYQVSYHAGQSGRIHGHLIVNPSYLIFNPNLQYPANLQKFTIQRLLKFNAIVQIEDIQDLCYMQLPQMNESEVPSTVSIVQFLLYRVGNTYIQTKYKERLKQLKLDHKAIASVSFTIYATEQRSSQQLAQQLVNKTRLLLPKKPQAQKDLSISMQQLEWPQEHQSSAQNRLTNIPFFDIIHANIQPKTQQKPQLTKIIHKSAILGTMNDSSTIVSVQQFTHLSKYMPVIYQLQNWSLIYNSTKHGTSFNTFLSKARSVQPAILLIKQYKGYAFGAFLIQNLQTGKTGRGEMFVFTYRQQETPQVYTWTGKNQTFVVCQKSSGVGIGMGFKYGIFLKNDLCKGSSSTTQTFGNSSILSKKEDFTVQEVELWGIDNAY